MNYGFRILLLFCLFSASNTLLPLDRQSTQAAAVDSADVVVDTSGNVYHMVYVKSSPSPSSTAQFGITKTDINGTLDQGFGFNGLQTLTVSASATPSSGAMINISGGAISLEANQKAVLALSLNNDLFLGFAVVVDDVKNICIVKLSRSTGFIDTSFGTSGVILNRVTGTGYAFAYSSYTLEDMTIDSSGRPITLLRLVGDLGSVALVVSRFTTGTNVLYHGVSASSAGCSVVTDGAGNVYVVGQELGYFFSVKLNESDLSTNTSYGTSGKAVSSNMGLDNNSAVFAAIEAGSVQVFAVKAIQLQMATVIFNPLGSVSISNSAIVFPSAAFLKSVMRRSDGKIYVAGTILSGGSQTTFLGRLSNALVGDVTFAQGGQANYLYDGIVQVLPTSGFTVASGQGGWLGFDDLTHTVAVVFAETNGLTTQLTRDFGIEASQFLTAPTPAITPSVVSTAVSVATDRARKDQAFAHLTLSGLNLTSIHDSGVVVTAYDDTICYLRSDDFYIFYKIKEDGTLDTSFNTNGYSKITLANSGASSTTVAITDFSSIFILEKSFIAYDPIHNDIVVQFKVNIQNGNNQIGVFKIKADTGLLDASFGANGSGVVTYQSNTDIKKPQGVLVDSSGRVIFFVHYTHSDGEKRIQVVRASLTGQNFDLALSFRSNNAMPEPGFDCALDYLGNIYVAGQYVTGQNRGLFCARLLSDGTLDTSFGIGGIYETPVFSELDGISTGAFLSMYEYDNTRNLQIIAKGISNSLSGVVVQQLNLSNGLDGSEDTTFGTAGKQFVYLSNLTTLNQAKRNEQGYLFCGGTITESAVVKSFLARITAAGVLDTTFGDASESTKLGMAKIDATSTWTVQTGGPFDFDSGAHCLFLSVESKNSNRQLIVQRMFGTNDLNIDVSNNGNVIGFILAYHLNSKNGLQGFIYLDGIVTDLQTAWKAVGGAVDNAAISSGISAFNTAARTALERVLAHATLNNHDSCLSLLHKPGLIKKIVSEAVKASVTTNQYTSMTAALDVALATISKRLNVAYKCVTSIERKIKKTV